MGRKPAAVAEKRSPVQAAFLAAYGQLGNITAAAKAAGCDPSNHRNRWCKDPVYLADFLEAQEQANDLLEAEALRRATRGTARKRKVGTEIVTEYEYSDSLLIFLLKANRPAKFRETVDHLHGGLIEWKAYHHKTPVDRV